MKKLSLREKELIMLLGATIVMVIMIMLLADSKGIIANPLHENVIPASVSVDAASVSDVITATDTSSTAEETGTTLSTTQTAAPTVSVKYNYGDVTISGVSSVTITDSQARARADAGKDCSYITSLNVGETYNVIGSKVANNGVMWFELDLGDKTGYVSGNTVKFDGKFSGAKAYLTFDDGPSKNTSEILDILDKYNAKATFFVIYHPESENLYKEIITRGHTIALHSYSHDYSVIYKSEDDFFNDLNRISDYVESVTGTRPCVTRFPGGSSNTVCNDYSSGIMPKLIEGLESRNYYYFDWNVDSGDAEGKSIPASKLLNNVKRDIGARVNPVILMHDTLAKTTTVEALPSIIEFLQSRGYTFETLSVDAVPVHHNIS